MFRILIPSSWTSINATIVESVVFQDGDVQVNTKSGVYGNSPFTLQTSGCGEEGEYIQISNEFIENYGNIEGTFGPPGQVFVHEWAKYRYGVFDEFGYPGDKKYPMFYYKSQWTMQGQVNEIAPNFCTNEGLVDYRLEDWKYGGACRYDEKTGLPDSNCFPVLGDGNMVKSSIMAIPYLKGNDQFCDDSEILLHQADIPTKHNDMCQGQSTFEVIKNHPDFKDYLNNNTEESRTPSFEILRSKTSSSFVMVLDVSGSMKENSRLDRLKASAKRWLTYDLDDEVPLGVAKFSSKASTVVDLTPVNNQSREVFAKALDKLIADGGTCLGAGLKEGLKVLMNGGVEKGGVMIFLTDGVFDCKNSDMPDKTTIAQAIPFIKAQEVRVITIAFSNNADPDIIKLAEETNGKAFFVPDNSGPEVINTAMQGSLTYQPAVPSSEVDIVIYETTYKNIKEFSFKFTIDELIGKDVSVQIDFSGNKGAAIVVDTETYQFTEENGVYLKSFSELAPGYYTVSVNSTSTIGFASVKITAKSRTDTIPVMTNCWTSIGNSKADMTNDIKIAVIARVLQGTNPVIGAKVTAYIERDDNPIPLEISLSDSGSEPDTVANDGLYARYFTSFDPSSSSKRYSLKCQVEGSDDTQINEGFIDVKRHPKLKSLPSNPTEGNPICCGSNTVREDSTLTPTGAFTRSSAGGSIEIVNGDKASYPPAKVTDLRTGNNPDNHAYFTLYFTSAGNVLDSGTAGEFKIFFTQNSTDLVNVTLINNFLDSLNSTDVLNSDQLAPTAAGTKVELNVSVDRFEVGQQYFFRLVTISLDGKKKTWSNIASFYNYEGRTESSAVRTFTNIFSLASALLFIRSWG